MLADAVWGVSGGRLSSERESEGLRKQRRAKNRKIRRNRVPWGEDYKKLSGLGSFSRPTHPGPRPGIYWIPGQAGDEPSFVGIKNFPRAQLMVK